MVRELVSPTATRSSVVCTTTETQVWYSTAGCPVNCPTGLDCFADGKSVYRILAQTLLVDQLANYLVTLLLAAVMLLCGCDRMQVKTMTTTVCATASPCIQCATGWGIVTISQKCSNSVATPTNRI